MQPSGTLELPRRLQNARPETNLCQGRRARGHHDSAQEQLSLKPINLLPLALRLIPCGRRIKQRLTLLVHPCQCIPHHAHASRITRLTPEEIPRIFLAQSRPLSQHTPGECAQARPTHATLHLSPETSSQFQTPCTIPELSFTGTVPDTIANRHAESPDSDSTSKSQVSGLFQKIQTSGFLRHEIKLTHVIQIRVCPRQSLIT